MEDRYSIWGVDKLVYGPVDRETLLRWVRDGRITSETWVHDRQIDFWLQGEKIDFVKPELSKAEGKPIRVGSAPETDGQSVELRPDSLRQFELFSDLSDHKLEQILMFSRTKKFDEGEMIVRKGDPGKSLYLIVEGHVTASITVGKKKESLAEIGAGDFFGELAVVAGVPRTATVTAESEMLIETLNRREFSSLLDESPRMAKRSWSAQ